MKVNKVFIATSIDGYIADSNGKIDWLDTIPEINTIDTGYDTFTADIDALVMGRNTYETLCGFDIEWPYKKPVFVLSNSVSQLSGKFKDDVQHIKGSIEEALKQVHAKGYHSLYIDGGGVIQSFLRADLIDEMVVTVIPVLLGGGVPLFGDLPRVVRFECKAVKHFLDAIVQTRYVRKRK